MQYTLLIKTLSLDYLKQSMIWNINNNCLLKNNNYRNMEIYVKGN